MQKDTQTEPPPLYLTAALQRLGRFAYLLLTLAMLSWSGNFVLGRAVRDHVPPIGLAFWRWSGGAILIIGFAWPYLKRDWQVILRHWRIVLLLSVLGITIFNTFVYTGLRSTTAINGVLMQSTMPVMIVVMSYLLFREKVKPAQACGIVISLAGVLIIVARGNPQVLLNLSLNSGDLWILAAVVCYAAYSALLRKRPPLHPLSFLAITFIVGAALLAPFYIWESVSRQALTLDGLTLLAIGYVAVFPSILAYLCFNRGVELIGANRAGLFFHLMPVFGSIMAVLFLGEAFQLFHTFGILLILTGIMLATRAGR